MREFVALVAHLRALRGHAPAQALAWAQWQAAPPAGADLACTQRLFAGHRPQRVLTVQSLRRLPLSLLNLPGWPEGLLQACAQATGDVLEALCLAMPEPDPGKGQSDTMSLRRWCEEELPRLAAQPDAQDRAQQFLNALQALPSDQRLLAADLATGRFRSPLVPPQRVPEPGAARHRLVALCTYLRQAPGGVQVAVALWRAAPPTPEQWQAALEGEGLAAAVGPWVTIGQLPLRADSPEEQAIAQALKAAGTRRVGVVQALNSAVMVWLRHEGATPNARRKCGWEMQGLQWDGLAEEDRAAVGCLADLQAQPL